MALGAGDAWFALDEGCFLVKGRLLVCSELELMASKRSIKCPSQRSVLAWSSGNSQNFGSCYWRCRVGATHMAFVQTADETASLLKLLRHRGGSVDRKLFGVVDFSSIEQNAMRRVGSSRQDSAE